jgi:hypothetical protein
MFAGTQIELTQRVVNFWPEFAQAGKEKITLGQLLCIRPVSLRSTRASMYSITRR